MSSVKWSKNAISFLDRLEKEDATKIVKKINKIKENPLRFINGLVNKDFGKIRIGDYRLFVDFLKKENMLIIRSIKHRKNAYKK